MKSACIVFSGGGLRGFTQIGSLLVVDEYLKKNNYKIKTVVGTSFGSISAATLACEVSPKRTKDYLLKKRLKLRQIIDLGIVGQGILRGNKLKKLLSNFLPFSDFSKTKIELKIHAVDIVDGTEYIFSKKGINSLDNKISLKTKPNIIESIKTSCAIPGIFPPTMIEGHIFVDGGLISPLALHVINPKDYDLVIAIDVSMGNFNFLQSKNPTKIQMLAQTVAIVQRKYHYEHIAKTLKKKNVLLIRPPVGPVNLRKKNELERMLNCGISEAKKILRI